MFEKLDKKQKKQEENEIVNKKEIFSPGRVPGLGTGFKFLNRKAEEKNIGSPDATAPEINVKHDREFDKRMKALHEKGRKRGRRYSIVGITLSIAISTVVLALGYFMLSEITLISDKIEEKKVTDIAMAKDTDNICKKDYCCLASLKKMQKKNYPIYNREVGCGDGFRYKKLDCEKSLEWCEPVLGASVGCIGEGSEYQVIPQTDENNTPAQCCPGLVSSNPVKIVDGRCNPVTEDVNVCINCADGICGSLENFCNCPEDCSAPENNALAAGGETEPRTVSPKSGLSEIDEVWNLYKNYEIGFAMRIPRHVNVGADLGDVCGELQVVQKDARTIQITGEKPFLECTGENNTNCRDLCQFKEYKFWQVNSFVELDNFLINMWGQDCTVEEQMASVQEGVYEIILTRSSTCAIEGGNFTRYYPERNIVVSWSTGENQNFLLPGGGYADPEMYNSFSFMVDSDRDELYNDEEVYYKTDSGVSDSDNDGFLDGDEVERGYNPNGEGVLRP